MCKVALSLGADTVICLPDATYCVIRAFLVLFITNMKEWWSVCQATCIFFTLIDAVCRVSLYPLSNVPSSHYAQEPEKQEMQKA